MVYLCYVTQNKLKKNRHENCQFQDISFSVCFFYEKRIHSYICYNIAWCPLGKRNCLKNFNKAARFSAMQIENIYCKRKKEDKTESIN